MDGAHIANGWRQVFDCSLARTVAEDRSLEQLKLRQGHRKIKGFVGMYSSAIRGCHEEGIRAAAAERALGRQAWRDVIQNLAPACWPWQLRCGREVCNLRLRRVYGWVDALHCGSQRVRRRRQDTLAAQLLGIAHREDVPCRFVLQERLEAEAAVKRPAATELHRGTPGRMALATSRAAAAAPAGRPLQAALCSSLLRP
eukprot:363618-Chlamydomonas_euryale.AAC.10